MRAKDAHPLRRRRVQLQITQRELAERARLHPSDVSRFESGRVVPGPAIRGRIAAAVDLPAADLWPDPDAAVNRQRRLERLLRRLADDVLTLGFVPDVQVLDDLDGTGGVGLRIGRSVVWLHPEGPYDGALVIALDGSEDRMMVLHRDRVEQIANGQIVAVDDLQVLRDERSAKHAEGRAA